MSNVVAKLSQDTESEIEATLFDAQSETIFSCCVDFPQVKKLLAPKQIYSNHKTYDNHNDSPAQSHFRLWQMCPLNESL